MRLRTATLLSFPLIALLAIPAAAQTETAATTTAATTAQPAAAAEAAQPAAPAQTAPLEADPQVAGALQELLRVHPAAVGTILELDPSLAADPMWVGKYPELQAFLARHPEVAANPRVYLGSIHVGRIDQSTSGERMVEKFLEGIMIFSVILLFILTGVWLIRTVVQERRWSRLSRTQAEVHAKLLDRFTANEELIAYVQSPAGRRFLESAPIPVESEGTVSAPISRMLWSIQVGIVIAAGAIGLLFASGTFEKDAQASMFALGTVALSVGVGFAISGVVSWVLSRRMGLLPRPQEHAAE